jgi:hypothetical protein
MSPVISAWSRQAIDYPGCDWIYNSHHDNGNRLGRLLGCVDRWQISNDKHIDVELDEFSYETWDLVRLSLSVAILNLDVFPLNITESSQPSPKCLQ